MGTGHYWLAKSKKAEYKLTNQIVTRTSANKQYTDILTFMELSNFNAFRSPSECLGWSLMTLIDAFICMELSRTAETVSIKKYVQQQLTSIGAFLANAPTG